MLTISNIPVYVIDIINILEQAGFSSYLVGGCVRDSVLGKNPHDWDITTEASPDSVFELFPHSIPTGLKHGTVSVVSPEKQIVEVTTFRIDGEYKDSRRPENVVFSKNINDDLSRRDFTMNAIAYSPLRGIADPFDGMSDIKNKKIRCVGNPDSRFSEDALRMMRAIRFSAVLDFDLSKDILDSILKLNSLLKNISIERIRDEFSKTLLSSSPSKILLYEELCLIQHFLPEFERSVDIDGLSLIPCTVPARMAYLLHSVEKDIFQIMKRMRFDNKICSETASICKCLNLPLPKNAQETRIMMSDKELFLGLLTSFIMRSADDAILFYQDTLSQKHCISIQMLEIDGNILESLGIKDGIKKGTLLKHLLSEALINPSLNTKENLIKIVQEIR